MCTDYTESCVSGVERLAVVHHYIYIHITFTFHLHVHLVVEGMRVTIPGRGIPSRRLAALITSLCQTKEVGITWLAWYFSPCTIHLVGDALTVGLGHSLPFSWGS